MQLIADKLSVSRGGRTIISRISFRIEQGTALVLTGPNGSGKTTLIRTIAGFLQPDAGCVELIGGAGALEFNEQCHYVAHANGLRPNLTVIENVRFWAQYYGPDETRRLEDALDQFDLLQLADIPAGYLSAGQQRRTGLARLKISRRPVWLLDEPTVALDAASVGRFASAVKEHLNDGGIVVAATHVDLELPNAQELRLARETEAL